MELDAKDRLLLQLMQQDCRLANAELADRAGLSPSACWRRVRAMQDAGVIRSQVAVLDARAAGFGFCALVLVSLSRHDRQHVDDFIAAIQTRPEVLECYATTGDADFHLRVVARDADAYNGFLDDFLIGLAGISRVRTNLVLKEIKQTTALPV